MTLALPFKALFSESQSTGRNVGLQSYAVCDSDLFPCFLRHRFAGEENT